LLTVVTPPEVQSLLKGEFQGDVQSLIKERKKAHLMYYIDGMDEVAILSGDEATRKFKEVVHEKETSDEITGQVAALGKYTGKVRKVVAGDLETLKESIQNFQQGEVLLTTMTQPNMMVIAKRAGAIVTDEGGITSHAAIISRELKIPCIVGCMHAMRTLKDGEVVEVDAVNGVVRKL
jgi:phosphoenolpyruvate synthase/pyruvate phosphate dikinase